MLDEKKQFTEPEIQVVEIEQADIICTSGQMETYTIENPAWY